MLAAHRRSLCPLARKTLIFVVLPLSVTQQYIPETGDHPLTRCDVGDYRIEIFDRRMVTIDDRGKIRTERDYRKDALRRLPCSDFEPHLLWG